jgi:hypothetical protein
MAGDNPITITSSKKATKRPKDFGKGKKRDVKRNIPSDLIPIEDETWLIQPIAVTMMRHDYSLIQIRILVSIVQFMQEKLHKLLEERRRAPQIFTDSELDDDGRLEVRVLFKTLGIDPNHYPQLRQSLKMLATIPVEIPYKTMSGRHYIKVTNLCDVYIPDDPGIYVKYAVLKIDRTVADRIVSVDLGWHRLGKQIVYSCRNRYTQRIYMFIASWADKGSAIIKTLEFRKMLRLESNYKKFSDFTRRVLEPAKEELYELAENGFCDCYFDYVKRYDHGQRGGEPDELVFKIYRPKKKSGETMTPITDMQRKQFANMLVRHFGFKEANAEAMSKKITPENYEDACNKLISLHSRLRDDMHITDKVAYTYRTLDNFFRGVTPPQVKK